MLKTTFYFWLQCAGFDLVAISTCFPHCLLGWEAVQQIEVLVDVIPLPLAI